MFPGGFKAGTDFNARPYVRGDIFLLKNMASLYYFNSRPYVRGDDMPMFLLNLSVISIPAPT